MLTIPFLNVSLSSPPRYENAVINCWSRCCYEASCKETVFGITSTVTVDMCEVACHYDEDCKSSGKGLLLKPEDDQHISLILFPVAFCIQVEKDRRAFFTLTIWCLL